MPPSTTGPSPPLPHQWEEVIGVQIAGTGKEGFTNQPDQALPCGSAGKESACNVGDLGSTPGLGRCPGEGKGYPLQYSGLENFMD